MNGNLQGFPHLGATVAQRPWFAAFDVVSACVHHCAPSLNSGFQEGEQKFGSFTAYEKQALGLDSKDVRDLKRDLLVG